MAGCWSFTLKSSVFWLVSFGLVALGKATGFLRDIFFTYYHGVSDVTDAYFIAMSVSSLVFSAVFASVPIVVVPLYARLRNSDESGPANGVIGVFSFYFLVSIILSFFVYFYSSNLVDIFSDSVSESVAEYAESYLAVMSLTFVLSMSFSYISAIYTVKGSYYPSYAAPLVNNVFFCGALSYFSSPSDFELVLYAGVFSWAALVFVFVFPVLGWLRFSAKYLIEALKDRSFLMLLAPAMLAFYVEQANALVSVYYSSGLGSGAVSSVGYANKLNLLFLSIFLIFLTTFIFPKMALAVASGDRETVRFYWVGFLDRFLYLLMPFFVACFFYSGEIVSLIFERGIFDSSDVDVVASVFSISILSIPLLVIRDTTNRVYFSFGNAAAPVVFSIVTLLSGVILMGFMAPNYGLPGLAAAIPMLAFINAFLGVIVTKRLLGFHVLASIFGPYFFSTVVAFLSYCLVFSFNLKAGGWIATLFLGMAIYYFLLAAFRVSAVLDIVRVVLLRVKNP